jgi:spermidine synthase
MGRVEEVARGESERGEVLLRRRDDRSVELRVNGVFVMDSVETTTERMLATGALAAVPGHHHHVLIGGLGLGYTLAEVLADQRVMAVTVAEIEPDLVQWHRAGLISPKGAGSSVLDDRRVTVAVGDIRDLVRATPEPTYDLVLLDIDNGPGHLVYDENAEVYEPGFLAACADAVTPGGVVALWSSESSAALLEALGSAFHQVWEQVVPVRLQSRDTTFFIYFGRA